MKKLALILMVVCFVGMVWGVGYAEVVKQLPISELFEVRRDEIKKEIGDLGIDPDDYYMEYKNRIAVESYDESPCSWVYIVPYLAEMWWVQIYGDAYTNFEDDKWVEDSFKLQLVVCYGELRFQVMVELPFFEGIKKENFRFVFQNSKGDKVEGEIIDMHVDPIGDGGVAIFSVIVPLSGVNMSMSWFSFHVVSKEYVMRVDGRWEFTK